MSDAAPGQPDCGIREVDHLTAGGMTLHSVRDGALHTIRLEGELDIATADDVERELLRVESTDALSIVLDLSSLRFIDSTGVRVVLYAHARSRRDANRLVLLRGPAAVQRVFELSGVVDRLPFAD
jgi:anti-sigma B factor antagonist